MRGPVFYTDSYEPAYNARFPGLSGTGEGLTEIYSR